MQNSKMLHVQSDFFTQKGRFRCVLELFKGVVSRMADLTFPVIPHSDVQRVVVPESARNPLLLRTVHSPYSSLFPVRSVPPSVPLSLCESRPPKNSSSYAITLKIKDFKFLKFSDLKVQSVALRAEEFEQAQFFSHLITTLIPFRM